MSVCVRRKEEWHIVTCGISKQTIVNIVRVGRMEASKVKTFKDIMHAYIMTA